MRRLTAAVIQEKMELTVPWDRVHDTMLLAFLADPFGELSLKPLCEQLLGIPPDERDAVKEWLIRNGICRDTKGWGAYISKAPGELVGTYAEGDVTRTTGSSTSCIRRLSKQAWNRRTATSLRSCRTSWRWRSVV